jgi:hypothetical protein
MFKKQHGVLLLAVFLVLVLAAGCGTAQKKRQFQQDSRSESRIQVDPELARRAGEAAGTVEGVKENAAVVINRDIAVALKVERFDRLRLKTIRKQVHDTVKRLDQEYNVHVTTDKKLFVQLQQMEQELNSPGEKPHLQEMQVKFDKAMQDMRK